MSRYIFSNNLFEKVHVFQLPLVPVCRWCLIFESFTPSPQETTIIDQISWYSNHFCGVENTLLKWPGIEPHLMKWSSFQSSSFLLLVMEHINRCMILLDLLVHVLTHCHQSVNANIVSFHIFILSKLFPYCYFCDVSFAFEDNCNLKVCHYLKITKKLLNYRLK